MGSEAQLVRDLKRSRNGVLETLYNTYAPTFLSVALRYCGNREDAEDVVHDGFIKIIRNIDSFKSRTNGSFEGWIKRIMINISLLRLL